MVILVTVRLAETWNVWSRPSPDQSKEMRENTSSSAVELLQRARLERPDYELPSELRVLKYKHMVEVEKMTATVLKKAGAENYALAEQVFFLFAKIFDLALVIVKC